MGKKRRRAEKFAGEERRKGRGGEFFGRIPWRRSNTGLSLFRIFALENQSISTVFPKNEARKGAASLITAVSP